MACFVVPAATAVVVSAIEKGVEKKEEIQAELIEDAKSEDNAIPMSRKLKWLAYMLIGGAILLAFEHIWHGEVTPWAPFLTAMHSASDTAEMLHEISTVGVCMAFAILAVWFAMCKVADAIVKRPASDNA